MSSNKKEGWIRGEKGKKRRNPSNKNPIFCDNMLQSGLQDNMLHSSLQDNMLQSGLQDNMLHKVVYKLICYIVVYKIIHYTKCFTRS